MLARSNFSEFIEVFGEMSRKRRSSTKLRSGSRSVRATSADKPSSHGSQPDSSGTQITDETLTESESFAEPSNSRLKIVLSIGIGTHLALLIIALASNYAPSYLQGLVIDYCSPYLATVHQRYGAAPLEITHGDAVDFPVAIEVRRVDNRQWAPLTLWPNTQRQDRSRWHNLARMVTIIAREQPEHEILAEIAYQLVKHAETKQTSRLSAITEIRLTQPHVLSFEEDLLVASGGEALLDSEFVAEVLYSAEVVRDSDNIIGVLPVLDPSRTSPATGKLGAQP